MKESEFIEGQMRAARYAEVSDRTIRRWLKAGMQRTENGLYIIKTTHYSQYTKALYIEILPYGWTWMR